MAVIFRLLAQVWLFVGSCLGFFLLIFGQTPGNPPLIMNAVLVIVTFLVASAVVWLVGTLAPIPVGFWNFSFPPSTKGRTAEVQFRESRAMGGLLFALAFPLAAVVMGAFGLVMNPKESFSIFLVGLVGVVLFGALLAHHVTVQVKADNRGVWIRSALGWVDMDWTEVKSVALVTTTHRASRASTRYRATSDMSTTSEALVFRGQGRLDLARIHPFSDPADGIAKLLAYCQERTGISATHEKEVDETNLF